MPAALPTKRLPRTAPLLRPVKQTPHCRFPANRESRMLARCRPVSSTPAPLLSVNSLPVVSRVVPRPASAPSRPDISTPAPPPWPERPPAAPLTRASVSTTDEVGPPISPLAGLRPAVPQGQRVQLDAAVGQHEDRRRPGRRRQRGPVTAGAAQRDALQQHDRLVQAVAAGDQPDRRAGTDLGQGTGQVLPGADGPGLRSRADLAGEGRLEPQEHRLRQRSCRGDAGQAALEVLAGTSRGHTPGGRSRRGSG